MAPPGSGAAGIGCGGNRDSHGSALNGKVAVTLTECTVFIFSRRGLREAASPSAAEWAYSLARMCRDAADRRERCERVAE